MVKDHPSFGKTLAIRAITMFYQYDIDKIKDDIQKMQQQYTCEMKFLKNLNLKVQRTEITNIMIRSILTCLSQLKQQMMEEKYKNGKSWVAISLQLYTSKAQLFIWHNEILYDIAHMMLYKIMPEDIFSRSKVLNMIHILDNQIEMLEKNYPDSVDPDILQMFKRKRSRFSSLYADMNAYFSRSIGVQHKILQKKLECMHATSQQIAFWCKTSEASVSHCLGNYRKELLQNENYTELFAIGLLEKI